MQKKILFLSVASAILMSTTVVNAQTINLRGGNTMSFVESNNNNPELIHGNVIRHVGEEEDSDFISNPNESIGNIPSSGKEGATAKQTKEQKLREMENEYDGKSTDAVKKEEDAKGHTDAQEAAKDELKKSTTPKAPTRRAKVVKPIGFSDISTFNTSSILQIESEARIKDGAAYQEFLRNPHNKK